MTNRLVADDVVEQSRQVLEVIKQEGVAIIPLDVAYAIVGNSKKSIETILEACDRNPINFYIYLLDIISFTISIYKMVIFKK